MPNPTSNEPKASTENVSNLSPPIDSPSLGGNSIDGDIPMPWAEFIMYRFNRIL